MKFQIGVLLPHLLYVIRTVWIPQPIIRIPSDTRWFINSWVRRVSLVDNKAMSRVLKLKTGIDSAHSPQIKFSIQLPNSFLATSSIIIGAAYLSYSLGNQHFDSVQYREQVAR